MKIKIIQVSTLILICFSIFCQFTPLSFAEKHQPHSIKTHSIYLSKTTWDTQEGTKVNLTYLQGRPVIVTMIYTGCQASCPVMMADLKAIEAKLSPGVREKIRFAVFAFDSKNDQPPQLKLFAKKHGVDLTHWTFFHGSPSSVRELAALLDIKFKQLEDGDFDHSNAIIILDHEGQIVHRQIGLRQNPKDSIEMLQRLTDNQP